MKAVVSSESYAEVCRKIGRLHYGGALRKTIEEIKCLELDTKHFNPMARRISSRRKPIEEFLVENCRSYPSSSLRKRLIKEECSECGIGPEWNGKYLSLQLDHINGNAIDNRIHNLRILCPNCHSQTENYTSKNKGKDTRWKK